MLPLVSSSSSKVQIRTRYPGVHWSAEGTGVVDSCYSFWEQQGIHRVWETEFPIMTERDLSSDVLSTSISNPTETKSILARRKRMEVRRFKMMMNGCPKFLDEANKRPRSSSSQPEEVSGKTPDTEAKLVILIEEGDQICGRVDVDILSSAPVRVSGKVSERKVQPASSVFRSGSLQVEGRPIDTKTGMVMGAVSINALAVIDRESACGSVNCGCNGQRKTGVLEAVCLCVKSSKAPSQDRSNCVDRQNVMGSDEKATKDRDQGGEQTVSVFPAPMCEIRSEGGNTRGRDDSCPPHGLVSLIGRRREMEDAAVAVPSFVSVPGNVVGDSSSGKNTALHFFGVYDGHGGSQAAVFCKDRLHAALAEDLEVSLKETCGEQEAECGIRWQQVMASCFLRVDSEMGGSCPRGAGCQRLKGNPNCCAKPCAPETVGTTAVVAVLSPTQIVVANCGDSRAVLIKRGMAIALSQDHKVRRIRQGSQYLDGLLVITASLVFFLIW
eukprot:c21780_g2_i1 orf=644-2134(-)